jgi:hypothetical protein
MDHAHMASTYERETQNRKMVGLLAHGLGGPRELRGRDLRTAHASLVERAPCDAPCDSIARDLDATLRELAVEVIEDDRRSSMSVDQFLTLPLRARVRLLLQDRIQFRRNGHAIQPRAALAAIYGVRAADGA